MKSYEYINHVRRAVLASCVITLIGCSSKPSTSDIENGLAQMYGCPLLEVSDTKKVNGIENGEDSYVVDYTFLLEMKDGQEGAIRFHREQLALEQEVERKRVETANARDNIVGWDDSLLIAAEAAEESAKQKALAPMQNCTTPSFLLLTKMEMARDAGIQQNPDAILLPVAAKFSGRAEMVKSEQGWLITGTPSNDIEEFVFASPMKLNELNPVGANN